MKILQGDLGAQEISGRVGAAVATVTELKAIPADRRPNGMLVLVLADGRLRRFHSTSALAADGDQLVHVPSAGSGRWLALPGDVVDLSFAIAFGTADAAVLYTVPTGANLLVQRGYWGVTADFTGGTSSAIGLSSSQAPHTTKGDLLGGAGGDVAATLVASSGLYIPGTVGADQAAGILLRAGSTVRFDRITSAFTAGTGFAHVVATVLSNAGA